MSFHKICTSSSLPLALAGYRVVPRANVSVLPQRIDVTLGVSLRR